MALIEFGFVTVALAVLFARSDRPLHKFVTLVMYLVYLPYAYGVTSGILP